MMKAVMFAMTVVMTAMTAVMTAMTAVMTAMKVVMFAMTAVVFAMKVVMFAMQVVMFAMKAVMFAMKAVMFARKAGISERKAALPRTHMSRLIVEESLGGDWSLVSGTGGALFRVDLPIWGRSELYRGIRSLTFASMQQAALNPRDPDALQDILHICHNAYTVTM